MGEITKKIQNRGEEITNDYFKFLDQHIDDVVNGITLDFFEIKQIASFLNISHSHLSDTVQQKTGHHPCHFYDLKIVEKAKSFLTETDLSINDIAKRLTYDPSNFSKFFKKFTGETPGQYRKAKKINIPKSSP